MTELKCGDWVWAWDDDKAQGCKALYLVKGEDRLYPHVVWGLLRGYQGGFANCEPYADQDKPKVPKKRLMTRDEALHFIANTSGIVARYDGGTIYTAQSQTFQGLIELYEWSYSSPTGEYEWNKFETEEA